MRKGGRPRDEVWKKVKEVEGGWKCNDCGEVFAGTASRIKAHLDKVKGKGIRPCPGKGNSNNDTEHNPLQGKVAMGKVGRRRDDVWKQVTLEEGSNRWICNGCMEVFSGGVARIKSHINKVRGGGIRPCSDDGFLGLNQLEIPPEEDIPSWDYSFDMDDFFNCVPE
ncbi:hypothetical protein K1719_039902 [Acacia pycnantha]|nr:hypothetical protein K1719_039902 [Acacia pycnantha]